MPGNITLQTYTAVEISAKGPHDMFLGFPQPVSLILLQFFGITCGPIEEHEMKILTSSSTLNFLRFFLTLGEVSAGTSPLAIAETNSCLLR